MAKKYFVEVTFQNPSLREETEDLIRKVVKKPYNFCFLNYTKATVIQWSWMKGEPARIVQNRICAALTKPLRSLSKDDPRRHLKFWSVSLYCKEDSGG